MGRRPPDHGQGQVPDLNPAPLLAPDAAGLGRAVALLQAGEVIAFPTDTVYGLAAGASNDQARQRLFDIKQRSLTQPLIVMAAERVDLEQLVELDQRARDLAARWWPGPLTLVLPAREGKGRSLGVRIPDHPIALALLQQMGEPLATTSANLSGNPPALHANEAAQLAGVAAVLDGGRAPGGQASTVLSLLRSPPRVLREGPLTPADLEI